MSDTTNGGTAGATGATSSTKKPRPAPDPGLTLRRSVELLWGDDEEGTRGPKPSLTRERVVVTAIGIADAEGLAALSIRRIAAALDVGPMSLYRYVPGKDELVHLMVDHVYAEDVDHVEALDGTWRERLAGVCRKDWAFYRRHPWMLHVPEGRPMLGPNSMRATEAALRALDGLGLGGAEMLDVIVTVNSWVAGLARTSLDAATAATTTGVSDDEWWDTQAPYLEKSLQEGRFPLLTRAGDEGAFGSEADDSFEFGLTVLLDGVAALVERAATRADGARKGARGS